MAGMSEGDAVQCEPPVTKGRKGEGCALSRSQGPESPGLSPPLPLLYPAPQVQTLQA